MRDPRTPTPDELERYAAVHHVDLSDDEREDLAAAAAGLLDSYERLAALSPSEPTTPADTDRSGTVPADDENPCNAFVRRCSISGDTDGDGLLEGYDVGLKDSVSLAGIELTCGSAILSEYVPSTDATVATRLLEAGATITGKLNMEDMAFSGSGELSAHGPVPNPHDSDHLAGGSSSGSGAAVVTGDVDVVVRTRSF